MLLKILAICNILLALTSPAISARVTNPNKVPKNAVLLSKINSLTLKAGKQTASRRVSAVPQLQCTGPSSVCKLYSVDVMRCTNEGSGYSAEDVEWSCKASLPEEFKLGGTDVSCEGYESSDDPYVLKGSCGVEYNLLLTDAGEVKYGKQDTSSWPTSSKSSEDLAGYLFTAIFLGVLFIILYNLYKSWFSDTRRPGGGTRPPYNGGGGGGGGGPNDDPPPPYDYQPPKKPRTYTPRTNTGSRANSSRSAGTQEQGWRPGFWTGTAAGAAAGYMFGNNRAQTRTQAPETQQRAGGGLFGGGSGGGGRSSWTNSPSSPVSRSSQPSFSSSRYESTGFGSTSRR